MNAKRMTRGGIDERAFPYDARGVEKPYYRARAGIKPKQRGTQEQFLTTDMPPTRRKEAFHTYTFKRKPERPQSAPAYVCDLGGSSSRHKSRGVNEKHSNNDLPSKPKMRPNSAHFLSTSKRKTADLDKFPAPRPARNEFSGSRQVFVHPTPPTDNSSILTHHEQMFYTHHFAKLAIKKSESEKYMLDEAYNRESRHYDHKTTTIYAPSNEVITDYRLGRKKSIFPPRVVQHLKTGSQVGSSVGQKPNHGIARNALGGFYS